MKVINNDNDNNDNNINDDNDQWPMILMCVKWKWY